METTSNPSNLDESGSHSESAADQSVTTLEETGGGAPANRRKRKLRQYEADQIPTLLLLSDRPLTTAQIARILNPDSPPEEEYITEELTRLRASKLPGVFAGVELVEVAQGWRWQIACENGAMVHRLYNEKPPRYSRAVLETLSIIAWRGPVTRGDIESIRGVAVSALTLRTLMEREWVVVKGYRDTIGKPELLATTRQFLDDFNLKSLDDLPEVTALFESAAVAKAEAEMSSADTQALHKGLGLFPNENGAGNGGVASGGVASGGVASDSVAAASGGNGEAEAEADSDATGDEDIAHVGDSTSLGADGAENIDKDAVESSDDNGEEDSSDDEDGDDSDGDNDFDSEDEGVEDGDDEDSDEDED